MFKASKIWRSLAASALVAGTLATMIPTSAFAATTTIGSTAVATLSKATASPNTPGAAAGYTIPITTTSALVAGVDTITIIFTVPTNQNATTGTFGLPATISKNSVSVSGFDSTAGAAVTNSPAVDPSVDLQAGSVTITVPDANPNGTVGVGHNFAAATAAAPITVSFGSSAGITNSTANSSSSYFVKAMTSKDTVSAAATIVIPRVLQLSNIRGAKGTSVTVTGLGYTTSANVFLDNGAGSGTTTVGADPGAAVTATTVTVAVLIGDPTITVASLAGLAPLDVIRVDNELMTITAIAAGPPIVLTVTRGTNGSAAAAHVITSAVTQQKSVTVASSAGYAVGDTAVVDSETMSVVAIPDATHLLVARGAMGSLSAAHAIGKTIYRNANNGKQDASEPALSLNNAVTTGKFTTSVTIGGGFVNGGPNYIGAYDVSGGITCLSAAMALTTPQVDCTRAAETVYTLLPLVATIAPASGKIGDLVTLGLQDYPALDVCAGGAYTIGGVAITCGGLNTTPAISADGTAQWSFIIPAGVAQGALTVSIRTPAAAFTASKTFTVNGATLVVNPSTVVPGQQITVSGSGFGGGIDLVKAGVTNMLTIDGAMAGTVPAPTAPDTKTDSGGSMVMQFKVPKTGLGAVTSPGPHTITLSDGTITGNVTITIATPTLTISPTTGLGGSTITFTGKGWASEQSVTVTYPATAPGNNTTTTVQSDTSGNVSGTLTLPSSANVAIPSDNTVTATALTGVQTASAIHSIPAASITITPTTGAPGTNITVKGTNFPIFQSLTTLTVGGNGVSVSGVNTDAGGNFTMTTLIPGLTDGTAAVVATVGTTSANTSITITKQSATVDAVTAMAALVNTQNLNISTSFDYATGKYVAYVPGLAGNTMVSISPNSVLFITMTKDTTVIVSGISFNLKQNVPTPLPVGAAVTIAVQ